MRHTHTSNTTEYSMTERGVYNETNESANSRGTSNDKTSARTREKWNDWYIYKGGEALAQRLLSLHLYVFGVHKAAVSLSEHTTFEQIFHEIDDMIRFTIFYSSTIFFFFYFAFRWRIFIRMQSSHFSYSCSIISRASLFDRISHNVWIIIAFSHLAFRIEFLAALKTNLANRKKEDSEWSEKRYNK